MEGVTHLSDRSQWTLYLAGIGVFLLLLIIAGLAWYKRRMDKLHDHIGGVPQGDIAEILKAVEGTRMQISSTGDELRGQMSIVKQRTHWVFEQLDKLVRLLRPKEPGE